MEKIESQAFSPGYRVFWSIYWVFALCFLAIHYRAVLGEEKVQGIGVLCFLIFLAAIFFTIYLTAFVMRPRRVYDERGKEVKARVRPWHFLFFVLVDIWCFHIMELVNNEKFGEMIFKYRVVNILGIFIMNMILFFWVNSFRRAMIITLSIFASFSIFFYLVYAFRGEPLQAIDFYSFGTAMNAMGNYQFAPTRWIVGDIVIGMCVMGVLLHTQDRVLARRWKGKLAMRGGVFAFMIAMFFFYTRASWNGGLGIVTDLFAPIKTYREVGTTVGFFCVAKYMRLRAPEGYNASETAEIAARATEAHDPATENPRGSDIKPVNIIAIMNESWCDYRRVGDLQTDKQVMPYYDQLTENTIKGHTLVCIRGGGTAKTEYEFLTGNSVKRYPGMVPYVSYFRHDQYSIVTTLEAQGYDSIAMHPYKATNWNRPRAYELLNFDEFQSEEDFDKSYERIRGFVSDRANYQKIIEITEEKEPGRPLFLFDITMQNHGGYTNNSYPLKIRLTGDYHDDTVERFLSLERATDDALEYLIEYYKTFPEPTLILVFGDHYPTLPDEFTESIAGSAYEDLPLDEQIRYFETPFLIWANYDIPEQEDVITSCNYLGTMLLEQTGLEMTDYNHYLQDLQKEMPALNHLGYYDPEGVFHSWDDADEEILQTEWEYECLQYNELAESRKRLNGFFSLEE